MLERKKSRRVFEQIRDDFSSLIVLRDSSSIFSTDTNPTSSKLSINFLFDGELLTTRVYQGTVRSLMRRVLHRGKQTRIGSIQSLSSDQTLVWKDKENTTRSNQIDALISEDSKEFLKKVDILVFGLPQSGKSTLLNRMRKPHELFRHDM